MPTFGSAITSDSTPATFNGTETMQPTTGEVVVQTAGAIGGFGQTVLNNSAPPTNPLTNIIQGGLQIVTGGAQVVTAVVTDVASDGALTPVDYSLAAGGIANIINGINTVTAPHSTVPSGPIGGGTGSALTPTQATQLEDAATGSWYTSPSVPSPTDIAAAVWSEEIPVGIHEGNPSKWAAGDVLGLAYEQLRIIFQKSWIPSSETPGVWTNYVWDFLTTGSLPTYTAPVMNWGDILSTETPFEAFARQNPSFISGTTDNGIPVLYNASYAEFYWTLGQDSIFYQATQWDIDYAQYRLYTPSSGPPERLWVQDFIVFFSLIPVRY